MSRGKFYIEKFLRELQRSGTDLNASEVLLLVHIVLREDELRYPGLIPFHDKELMGAARVQKWHTLHKIRERCVALGWLAYERQPKGSRRPAKYRVRTPQEQYTPEGVDETFNTLTTPAGGYCEATSTPAGGYYSSPRTYPNKDSAPKSGDRVSAKPKRFRKPTVADVTAFVQEHHLNVDAETFIDHYQSNGWRVGGKSPMKCWKSAVRNWHRRSQKDSNGKTAPTAEEVLGWK